MRPARKVNLDAPERPLVCVDLNGVLDSYSGWKHSEHWDPPRPGAAQFLESLLDHGFDIVIFTTRHAEGVNGWLRDHGLMQYVSAVTAVKPAAHVFVDDRAVCFRGDYAETLKQILDFKAHWE